MMATRRQALSASVYRAFTVELILTPYPALKSIRDLGKLLSTPWKIQWITRQGSKVSLDLRMRQPGRLAVAFLLSVATAIASAQSVVEHIGRFAATDANPPAPWQVVRLDERVPATQYRVMTWDGVNAVEAVAKGSMALLQRPLSGDLRGTPVLCWRWRVDAVLKNADMATRQGDDYAARVYVGFRLPADAMDIATRAKLMLGRSRYGDKLPDAALSYVWDNRNPVGTERPNAYTDRAHMVVLQSGAQQAGRWMAERRDILLDVSKAFGSDKASPTLLAIATDTDNTGESARAGFADLHFVARNAPCAFPS